MNHKIRLGPVAVFLAVIAAVVATLAILTFATSRADVALAERFAAVTAIRYELDEEGNRFLQAVEETAERMDTRVGDDSAEAPGTADPEKIPTGEGLTGDIVLLSDGGWKYYTEKDGYALTIEVVPAEKNAGTDRDPESGNWLIRKWKINKLWEGDDPFDDLWLG